VCVDTSTYAIFKKEKKKGLCIFDKAVAAAGGKN